MDKVTFLKGTSGLYTTGNLTSVSDQLLILSLFLTDDISKSPEFELEWLSSEDDGVNLDVTSLEKKNNYMIELNYQYIDDLDPVIMPIPKLIELIYQWSALMKKKADAFCLIQEGNEFRFEEIRREDADRLE